MSKHAIMFDQERKVTRGSFKDEVDINNIVERFASTGELPRAHQKATYGDAPSQDLHEAACVQAELRSKAEEGAFDKEEPELETEEKEPEDGSEAVETESSEEVATDERD